MARRKPTIPAAPMMAWVNRQLEILHAEYVAGDRPQGATKRLAERLGVSESQVALWRDGKRVGDGGQRVPTDGFVRETVEDALWRAGVFLWELYDDVEEDDEEEETERPVDSRGRDLTKPRGVPCRLSDAQVDAAYRLHMEGGLSIRELGRRGWRAWGYSSAKVAANMLSEQFKLRGYKARERTSATAKSNVERGFRPQCSHVFKLGARKGQRCERRCNGDDLTCWHHRPENIEAGIARLRHESDPKQIAA